MRFPKKVLFAIVLLFVILALTILTAFQNPKQINKYTLKEYQGRIGVFFYNEKQPRQVLDVVVDELPKKDAEQLKSGFYLKSKEELLQLIEDLDG